MEILRDRIEIEYGIKAELGRMRVAYRESVGKKVQSELTLGFTFSLDVVHSQSVNAPFNLSLHAFFAAQRSKISAFAVEQVCLIN